MYSGTVIERLNSLRAPMLEYKEMGDRVRLVFDVPSRLLLGIRSALRNDTRGSAVRAGGRARRFCLRTWVCAHAFKRREEFTLCKCS